MAIFGNMSITNAGQTLYTKAQAGKPIVFTKMSIGSGQIGTQNPATLTTLVQAQFDVLISSITPNTLAQSAAISGTINNTDMLAAIYICEIGLWAMDPDVGLILYGYASAGTQGDYMAPATQGAYSWMYQINAAIGNAANVTANISSILYDYSILGTDLTLTVINGGNQKAINKNIDNALATHTANIAANAASVASQLAETTIQLAGGSTNAITVATDGNFLYTQFRKVSFKATATNTGNVTINVDGKGVVPFLKFDSSQMPVGGIVSGKVYDGYYDISSGGRFFLIAKASGNTTAAHVLAGDTCGTDNGDIVGTMPNNAGIAKVYTVSTADQAVIAGYTDGVVGSIKVKGESALLATNIVSPNVIGGIIGTATIETLGGRRSAKGSGQMSSQHLIVTGLSFTPSIVIFQYTPSSTNYNMNAFFVNKAQFSIASSYDIADNVQSSSVVGVANVTCNSSGFDWQCLNWNMNNFNWIAIE